jgi:hypothetical protein
MPIATYDDANFTYDDPRLSFDGAYAGSTFLLPARPPRPKPKPVKRRIERVLVLTVEHRSAVVSASQPELVLELAHRPTLITSAESRSWVAARDREDMPMFLALLALARVLDK